MRRNDDYVGKINKQWNKKRLKNRKKIIRNCRQRYQNKKLNEENNRENLDDQNNNNSVLGRRDEDFDEDSNEINNDYFSFNNENNDNLDEDLENTEYLNLNRIESFPDDSIEDDSEETSESSNGNFTYLLSIFIHNFFLKPLINIMIESDQHNELTFDQNFEIINQDNSEDIGKYRIYLLTLL
jgi:hypothetical protein